MRRMLRACEGATTGPSFMPQEAGNLQPEDRGGTARKALAILGQDIYPGFGPTLAAEYLAKQHKITVSRGALRG